MATFMPHTKSQARRLAVEISLLPPVEVPIIPFNGQTTSNHTKLSMPSRSPLDFSAHMPLDMSNGSSRRVASGHQILPTNGLGDGDEAPPRATSCLGAHLSFAL